MELPCDREIVGGTARLAAQLPERKDGDALQCLWNVQRPSAADVEVEARHMRAVLGRIVGEAEDGGRQRGGRDRKSVVWGTGVSVRVDFGVHGIINKQDN